MFTDAKGRTWNVDLRLSHFEKFAAVGFDVDAIQKNADGGGLLQILAMEPKIFGAVMWIICEKQAGTMTADEFADGFDLATIQAARRLLLEAVMQFAAPVNADVVMKRLPVILENIQGAVGKQLDLSLSTE